MYPLIDMYDLAAPSAIQPQCGLLSAQRHQNGRFLGASDDRVTTCLKTVTVVNVGVYFRVSVRPNVARSAGRL